MNNPSDNKTISRRTMLASAGAAVAVTTMSLPAMAQDKTGEVQDWRRLVGTKFTLGRTGIKAVLVGVDEYTSNDPNRPAHFRQPFTLIFKPGRSRRRFEEGTHRFVAAGMRPQNIFVNETMMDDYGSSPVIQAVFG